MPLGVTNAYILTVGGSTYDLRRVAHVGVAANPSLVTVQFDWGDRVTFVKAVFEPAYQAALVALGGAPV